MNRPLSLLVRVACASAVVAAPVLATSVTAAHAAGGKISLAVVARDYHFSGVPNSLPAATYSVNFINVGDEEHEFVAVNLGPQCGSFTKQQALAELNKGEDAFFADCPGGSFEGAAFAAPGQRDRETVTLTPGRTLYFCGVPDENGVPHFELGMIGFINVRATPVPLG